MIVGGGFGGLNLAKKLVCKKDLQVTLVDINNYHFFPPTCLPGFHGFYRAVEYFLSIQENVPG